MASDSDPYYESKLSAAKLATSLVDDGDVIYIGGGSTCAIFAGELKKIQKHSLTIVTNSLNAAQEIAGAGDAHIVFVGGDLKARGTNLFTDGINAIATIKNIFIQKVFFTVDGISKDFGYTVAASKNILTAVMQQSTENIVIADISKFGKRSLARLDDALSVHTIVTNADIPSEYKEYFFENKIRLYTSFED